MSFNLQDFVDNPSFEKVDVCRKDDLLCIAAHFDITVHKYGLKKEIKTQVLEKLVDLNVLSPAQSVAEVSTNDVPSTTAGVLSQSAEETAALFTPPADRAGKSAPATLPRFDPFSPSHPPGFSSSSKLKVRLTRLQLEAQEKESMRKAEYDLRLQVRKLEIEADKEVRLKQLEVEALKISSSHSLNMSDRSTPFQTVAGKQSFDVSKNISLVPAFREAEVDSYFSAFERIASALDWPRDMWPILLQCTLIGKAQEVVSALSLQDSLQYDSLKEAILRAYELVPEAYRQKFRNHRKSNDQTFVEFAREKGTLFDKWCAASDVKNDFESLRQLVLLEEFKGSLPDKVVMFLNEQKVSSISKAAVLADEFVLTHKNVFVSAPRSDRTFVSRSTRPGSGHSASEQAKGPWSHTQENRECFYCHKKGHVVADCLTLKRKQQSSLASQQKDVCLIKTLPTLVTEQSEDVKDKPDPCFKPFISEGFVSLTSNPKDQKVVTLLRDSAGSQSIIRDGVLPLSSFTSCQSSVKLRGVGMVNVLAPLHRIHLQCPLLSGWFDVAVLPDLPVAGVDFLLCNDIAGGKVSSTPVVMDVPVVTDPAGDSQDSSEIFPACAVTRAQTKKYGADLSDSFIFVDQPSGTETLSEDQSVFKSNHEQSGISRMEAVELPATREEFMAAQQSDKTLQNCFSSVLSVEDAKEKKVAYLMDHGLLVRHWSGNDLDGGAWNVTYQVVVPTAYRSQVLSLAHDNPWAGHLGITKTYNGVLRHFFWPGLKADVVRHCRLCHVCQVTGKPNQVISPAPLCPIPVMGEPFEKVIVDCVGPLPKTKSGNQFLLTIMCVSTRFPEAVPLRRITAPVVSKALIKFFTKFGLPKVVQTDQGTNFTSRVFAQVLKTLGIKHIMSSPYHPESQGALERFHQTLKSMLRKHCFESQKDWDDAVPFVLFAAREAVQESLGYSPAELVFGHQVRGPLKLLKEQLLLPEGKVHSIPDYVAKLRARLQRACSLARESLSSAQVKMKKYYDQKATAHSFQPGDKVLILSPISGSALSSKFSGPYLVEKKVSDTNFIIQTPDRRRRNRLCHVNMMKPYFTAENESGTSGLPKIQNVSAVSACSAESSTEEDGLVMRSATPQGLRLKNTELLSDLSNFLSHLPDDHRGDVENLISGFPCLFGDIPSQTSVLMHDIVLTNPKPIKQHAYRVNPAKRECMRKEVNYLVENGFAVPSSSSWSSPCVLDAKSDGSQRFCTDFRKVNSVTVPDAHPLPLIEDCIDEVGPAEYVSKLDMLKGYWQVPLTPRASEISAFVTPDSFLQYTVMPFGLCNAPATFQRLVNKVLRDVPHCKAYLDDIVIYSDDWNSHMATLRDVFKRLAEASLTLNLSKCEFGRGSLLYLGQQVGRGQVCPADVKITAIAAFPEPTTRRELRRFLGMAGYYRRFCKNFSTVAAPLTALTSPLKPFTWSSECQQSFEDLKWLLSCNPVLSAPNFSLPFKLEVDASAVGAGAVLLQEDFQGIDHPVAYFSRKFDKHQLKYSTIEKETLALLYALQHFEVYLVSTGKPIKVFTDHNPLVFLSRMYNSNHRLMRWSLIVQNYNLEIVHKKGSENVLADALSRAL